MPNFTNMKSEKEKLSAKSVDQLRASYKRMGGKMVNGDGKAKTKVDLINGIVMKNRLAGKSMGAKHTGMAKKPAVKKTMAKKPAVKTMAGEQDFNTLPEVRIFTVSTLSKTASRPQRTKITDTKNNQSLIIPFGYKGSKLSTASQYLNSIGIKLSAKGSDDLITKNTTIKIK